LREKPTRADLLALALSIIGLGIFFGTELRASGVGANPKAPWGLILAVASSWGFGGLPIGLRLAEMKLTRQGENEAALAALPPFAMALGNLLALVICAPAFVGALPMPWFAASVIAALGVFQIGVPYILYGYAVRRLTALESTLIATVEPLINPLWVFLIVGETPGRNTILGGACIALGVVIQQVVRGTQRANVPS
jgi:drug/metabolite transporter, DME family